MEPSEETRLRTLLGRATLVASKEYDVASMSVLAGGGNTGAQVLRVNLRKLAASETKSVIMKTVETNKIAFSPAQRENSGERFLMYLFGYTDARMFKIETLFYSEWKPLIEKAIGVQLFPEIYLSEFYKDESTLSATRMILYGRRQHASGAIVMEDLSGGIFFKATSTSVDPKALELMVRAAASFSGSSVAFLKTRNVHSSFQYQLSSMNAGIVETIKIASFKKGTSKLVAKLWGDSKFSCLRTDKTLMEAMECLEDCYRRLRSKSKQFPIRCLVQGDMHAQNFAYFPTTDTVKMFDMQMWGIGSPAIELAYLLASNTSPEDESLEASLIRISYESLMANYPQEGKVAMCSLKEYCALVRMAQIEFTVALLVRRSKFETPQAVAKAVKRQGEVAVSLQQVMLDRELRWLTRVKLLFIKHGRSLELDRIADVT